MRIICKNEKEVTLIKDMCDIILRGSGIKYLPEMQNVLNSIEKPKKPEKPKTKGKQHGKRTTT